MIIGERKHTFPSRTRSLSSQPPMVVRPRCCARVGCCQYNEAVSRNANGFFHFMCFTLQFFDFYIQLRALHVLLQLRIDCSSLISILNPSVFATSTQLRIDYSSSISIFVIISIGCINMLRIDYSPLISILNPSVFATSTQLRIDDSSLISIL